MDILKSLKQQYKNLVMDSQPVKKIEKNIMVVDGGNSFMKFLTPDGETGSVQTARVKIEKEMDVMNDQDYYVRIEKQIPSGSLKNCGEYLFGTAAIADHRFEDIELGSQKFNDDILIYQIITIVADKARKNEPVELRTMLPFTQLGYKETYKKAIKGKYKITFLNRKTTVLLDIKTVNVAAEGSYSLRGELDKIISSKEIANGGSEYATKIICMFDIGGGQVDIPGVVIDNNNSTPELFKRNLKSFSTNFGMKYIATLLLQDLEKNNIRTTTDKVIDAIMTNENMYPLLDGGYYDFTKELHDECIKAFRSILKSYIEYLKAQGISNHIGLIYLAGGGAISLIRALTISADKRKKPDSVYYQYKDHKIEIRVVGDPIYHNVIGLRD